MKRRAPKKNSPGIDRNLLIITLLLTFLGLVAVADASAPVAIQRFSDKFYLLKQQAFWAFIGVVLMIVLSKVNYKVWEKFATTILFVNMFALILVFVPGLGIRVLGAKRWLDFGFFSFQPSEFIKLALVIYFAKLYSRNKKFFSYIVPLFLISLLIMLQPDLGTTLVIVTTSIIQIFVTGVSLLQVFLLGIVGIIGSFLLIIASDYRRERLTTFLKLSRDPLGEGYHIRQVLLALGSGGLWGVGLGHSRQKYLFLPETATDSIFAIIAEEVGFLGASVLLLLIGIFIFRIFSLAKKAPDNFSYMLAIGVASWISIQTIFNIGSMVALIPLTGIPLPFISYGGSSLMTMLIGIGILLNISRYAKK